MTWREVTGWILAGATVLTFIVWVLVQIWVDAQ
jgi:hypothetical protein